MCLVDAGFEVLLNKHVINLTVQKIISSMLHCGCI